MEEEVASELSGRLWVALWSPPLPLGRLLSYSSFLGFALFALECSTAEQIIATWPRISGESSS